MGMITVLGGEPMALPINKTRHAEEGQAQRANRATNSPCPDVGIYRSFRAVGSMISASSRYCKQW